jgi:predicted nucleic acid-binding protein
MNFLLDTNHWSYLQEGHTAVVQRVRSLAADSALYMPVVAQAELLSGVVLTPPGKRRTQLQELYEKVVEQATDILGIDSYVAERFAMIVGQLRQDGRVINTNDMWIAAIALAHELTVISSDRHFGFIRDLRVEDWTES